MKAWMFYDFGDMRLEEVPYPELKAGWVILKPRVVQPSVTEAIVAKGFPSAGYERVKRRLAEEGAVQLFGHEYSAEVVEVAEGVKDLKVRDRVTGRHRTPCYKCALCLSGREDECHKGGVVGFDLPGCFAEYFTMPAVALAKLPDSVTDEEAASMQPLSSAVPAVEDAGIKMGDTVAVFGQGQMGLYCNQVAKVNGAGIVIGIDIHPRNLEVAQQLGADVVIDALDQNPAEVIRELSSNLGADVIFEAAGGSVEHGLAGAETLKQSIAAIRECGTIVQIAILGPVTLDLQPLINKYIRYIFKKPPTRKHLEYAIGLVASKRVLIKPTLTHSLRGMDKVPEAFEIVANKAKYGAINPAQVVISD